MASETYRPGFRRQKTASEADQVQQECQTSIGRISNGKEKNINGRGGVDLVLTKGSERTFVQCKQWRANRVGVTVVRELYGVMAAKGAAAGVVVTSGSFTDDAKAFASGRNIDLMDGAKLMALLKAAQTPPTAPTRPAQPAAPDAASANVEAAPSCPRCEATMVRRQAKQGPNAGKQFWGCAKYPKCRGTIGG